MDKLKDISLYYFGGSGGFLLLHLLMLSDQFYCSFYKHKNVSFTEILKKQWNIKNHHDWKKSEIWPHNAATFSSITDKRKIYFYCNPTAETIRTDTLNILLYTDVRSQLILSKYKNAFDFFQFNRRNYLRRKIRSWQKHYNDIKDDSWPVCPSLKKFKYLPYHVKQELLLHPYTKHILTVSTTDRELVEESIAEHISITKDVVMVENNEMIFSEVSDIMQRVDKKYKLQDIVNNISLMSDLTHSNTTDEQKKLLNHWKSLHTKELLNSIGIKE